MGVGNLSKSLLVVIVRFPFLGTFANRAGICGFSPTIPDTYITSICNMLNLLCFVGGSPRSRRAALALQGFCVALFTTISSIGDAAKHLFPLAFFLHPCTKCAMMCWYEMLTMHMQDPCHGPLAQ